MVEMKGRIGVRDKSGRGKKRKGREKYRQEE